MIQKAVNLHRRGEGGSRCGHSKRIITSTRKHGHMLPKDRQGWSSRTVAVVVLVLTVTAAVPRLVELGQLSFYGDEETTALVAKSVAQGDGPTMPSGMTYRRALPLTWANAASARLLGLRNELAYRLPAAMLGALTVPLLFLFGRRFVGETTALVAATLLAVSEWHLVFSRMARMYGPFLFFFLLATWAVWRWAGEDDVPSLAVAVLAVAAAATLHTFAVFLAAFALIPVGLSRWSRAEGWKLLLFAGLIGSGIWFGLAELYRPGFGQTPPPLTESAARAPWQLAAIGTGWKAWTLVALGIGLGGWAGLRALRAEPGKGGDPVRSTGMVLTLAAAGAMAFAGLLYGAGLFALLFLLVYRGALRTFVARVWPHLAAGTAVACVQVALKVNSLGLVEGAKAALVFPFPYLGVYAREFPVLTGVFVLVAGGLLLFRSQDEKERHGLRAVILASLLPLLAVGLTSRWGGMRYLLPAYPFLLLATAAGLVAGTRWLTRRLAGRQYSLLTVGVLLAVVLAGAFRHHGVAASLSTATLAHGEPVDADIHQQPFRPDHEGAGKFLRSRATKGDVVIAEDPLEQYWYAGEVNYWLRSYGDARRYLYVADGNRFRDMYVNSVHIRDVTVLDSLASQAGGQVWLVTSGETAHNREYYLDAPQRRWLDSLQAARHPAYVARDSVTRVYCLNC